LVFINDYAIPLEIGLVTTTKEFDNKNQYDGRLGAIYHTNYTDFYVWSPVAKEINLILDNQSYEMANKGLVWHVRVKGDLHLKPYYYDVRNLTYFEKVLDPYAKAGTNDYSYVLNPRRLSKVVASPIKICDKTKAIIYEGHVRDMTINLDGDDQGLFTGLVVKSKTLGGTVLEYIKGLGITHLQLLPVTDFLGVDDYHKDKLYNWGYNPHQFFLLDGWYSKDPNDPILRINEFIKVINHAHRIGLGINLDVVYNHVYDYVGFSVNKLIPNYMYQFDKKGHITNFSGCQNDVASFRYMVRRLIVDSLVYLAKTFKIDGFRFDLMGLMDIPTMLIIEEELKKINPNIMLYGEGWNIPNTMPRDQRANMSNQKQIKGYAHFNDQFRNHMKGTNKYGYAMGNDDHFETLKHSLLGSLNIFDSPNQSINYVECHDNYTFYDEISLKTNYDEFKKWHYQDFATHLVIIAQGIPFIHAGQEFYRTKKQVENSYKSPDDINMIVWNHKLVSVEKLRELINIRKTYKIYNNSNSKIKTVTQKGGFVIYTLENQKMRITHYLQNDYYTRKINLEQGEVLFASQDYLLEPKSVKVSKPGVYAIIEYF
jgi:pullulanase